MYAQIKHDTCNSNQAIINPVTPLLDMKSTNSMLNTIQQAENTKVVPHRLGLPSIEMPIWKVTQNCVCSLLAPKKFCADVYQ